MLTPSEALFTVVARLTALMAEENRLLAAGLPATAAGDGRRKEELSERFHALWTRGGKAALAGDPAAARRLIAAVARLQRVTEENMARLETALAASRRRVDGAVAAMRGTAAIVHPPREMRM